jgi:hypothetical protein
MLQCVRSLVVPCVVLLGATTVSAQGVSSVSPSSGTVGAALTIKGSDFGEKKGWVLLVHEDTGKEFLAKVTSWTDTKVQVEVKKALAGDCFVVVIDKQGGLSLPAGNFEAKAPQVGSLSCPGSGLPSGSASPGLVCRLQASFLGTKKGSVRLAGKACKVVEWGDAFVDVITPKVPNGYWLFDVSNSVGTGFSYATVQDSTVPLGSPRLKALLGTTGKTKKWKLQAGNSQPGTVQYFASKGALGSLRLDLPFTGGVTPVPGTLTQSTPGLLLQYTESAANGGSSFSSSGGSASVVLQAFDGTRLAGSFGGTLTGADGSIAVSGTFIVDV